MSFEQQRRDYVHALSWVSALMAATPSTRLPAATPCTEFDVRQLMGHLVGTARRGLATGRAEPFDGIPHVVTDVADGDLSATYAELAADIARVYSGLPAEHPVLAPWGDCTAWQAVRGFTLETVVHGWDLAVATGQPDEAPRGIAHRCLGYADAVVPERLRGVMYADALTDDAGLGATERLANRLGHRRR